jgi:hypothetical protein
MNPEIDRDQIISLIEQKRAAVVNWLLNRIYADPFWVARFGVVGRTRAEEDINYHLDNLIVAIRFDLSDSTKSHYQYLQSVLLPRGICTRHIRETIEGLQFSLVDQLPQIWPQIEPYLSAGYAGLLYHNPASLALSEQDCLIAERIMTKLPNDLSLGQDHPGWTTDRQREVLVLLSYLADAMEKNSPNMLSNHIHWLETNHVQSGIPDNVLDVELSLLSKEITQQLPRQYARQLRNFLRKID